MRLAVIGDVHANLHALDAVLAEADRRGAGSIVCLGDLVGYGAHPDTVAGRLREREVVCLQGNYDDAVGGERDDCGCGACCGALARLRAASLAWTVAHTSAATKAWLRSLPPRLDLTLAGRRIVAFHGGPAALNQELGPGDADRLDAVLAAEAADVLLLGHSHRAWCLRRPGGLVLNPGSVGKPLGTPQACWAMLDLDDDAVTAELHETPYDVEGAVADLLAAGLPATIAGLLRSGAEA